MEPLNLHKTKTTFKSGEISRQLGVTIQTVRRWVYRFPQFFSDSSQQSNRYHIFYTEEDVLVLATIHTLSAEGHGLDDIEVKLEAGIRLGESLLKSLQAETSLFDAAPLRTSERNIQGELRQVMNTLRREEEKNALLLQENQTLLREIAELKFQLGVAQGRLEAFEQKKS